MPHQVSAAPELPEMVQSSEAKILAATMQAMREDLAEVKLAVSGINDTLKILAKLEVQHSETSRAVERAFAAVERIDHRLVANEQMRAEKEATTETRIRAIEVVMPGLKETRTWVIGLAIGCVGMVFVAMATIVIRAPASFPGASFEIQQAPKAPH